MTATTFCSTFLKLSTSEILPCPLARFSNFQLQRFCHVLWHVSQTFNFGDFAMSSGTFLKLSTSEILPCPLARFSNFQLQRFCHVLRHVSQIFNFKNFAMSSGTFLKLYFKNFAMSSGTFLKFSTLKISTCPPTIFSIYKFIVMLARLLASSFFGRFWFIHPLFVVVLGLRIAIVQMRPSQRHAGVENRIQIIGICF